jgi:hypothetical protein
MIKVRVSGSAVMDTAAIVKKSNQKLAEKHKKLIEKCKE